MNSGNLTELEIREDAALHPYAMLHRYNGGRINAQESQPYRTCFQRDRDRVIHSKSFRRLGYKTQVFVNSRGDNYRTRLTHSMEVAQISRSVAGALGLNRDFAESIALIHDLGHTPFGHAGQEILHKLMADHGGFEHNCQSLRIIGVLEKKYLDFPGLNPTRATLKGIMKRGCPAMCEPILQDLCQERKKEGPSLEAAIVDVCDRIAYIHHDLEDGLDSGYLEFDDLFSLVPWEREYRKLESSRGKDFTTLRKSLRFKVVLRELLNTSVLDLIENTRYNIEALKPQTLEDILTLDQTDHPVGSSQSVFEELSGIKRFLTRNLYQHPDVIRMSLNGSRIIELLFSELSEHPEVMPRHVQERIPEWGLHRTVADYLAGMTDRYAQMQYRFLTGTLPHT